MQKVNQTMVAAAHPQLADSARLASQCVSAIGMAVEGLLLEYGKGVSEKGVPPPPHIFFSNLIHEKSRLT